LSSWNDTSVSSREPAPGCQTLTRLNLPRRYGPLDRMVCAPATVPSGLKFRCGNSGTASGGIVTSARSGLTRPPTADSDERQRTAPQRTPPSERHPANGTTANGTTAIGTTANGTNTNAHQDSRHEVSGQHPERAPRVTDRIPANRRVWTGVGIWPLRHWRHLYAVCHGEGFHCPVQKGNVPSRFTSFEPASRSANRHGRYAVGPLESPQGPCGKTRYYGSA